MAPCEARVHTHACWREPCENRAVPHARGARARARTKKSIHAAYKSCHVLSVASRAFACARAGRGRGTPSATGGTQSKGTDKRALCSVQIKSLDKKLRKLVAAYGNSKIKWIDIAKEMPNRDRKSCGHRWRRHLSAPLAKKGPWTKKEDKLIADGIAKHGTCWTEIAKKLPGRTAHDVMNRVKNEKRKAERAIAKKNKK